MGKNITKSIVAIAILGAVYYVNLTSPTKNSPITMSNIEALSGNDDQNYEERESTTMSIWDDEAKIYKSLTVISCQGKGDIVCP